MIFNKLKYILVFIFCLSLAIEINAQTDNAKLKMQSTAVPFLMISPDARSGGMGNLSLGMTPEANDLFGNTAKLPYLTEDRGFLINYTPWLKDLGLNDVYLASAGYYKKLNSQSAINTKKYFAVDLFSLAFKKANRHMSPIELPVAILNVSAR